MTFFTIVFFFFFHFFARNYSTADSPHKERYRFVVGALEDLLLLPAFYGFHPFLARASPVFRDKWHRFVSIVFFLFFFFIFHSSPSPDKAARAASL